MSYLLNVWMFHHSMHIQVFDVPDTLYLTGIDLLTAAKALNSPYILIQKTTIIQIHFPFTFSILVILAITTILSKLSHLMSSKVNILVPYRRYLSLMSVKVCVFCACGYHISWRINVNCTYWVMRYIMLHRKINKDYYISQVFRSLYTFTQICFSYIVYYK